MELQERFISAVLGALWGAVLGLLVAAFFHYVAGRGFNNAFLILHWRNTILSSAVIFAIVGFIFKASAGTIIGTLMSWVWAAIEYYRETFIMKLWLVLLFLAAISYWFFTAKKD